MELPIKLEGILFAKENNFYKFLILKRTLEEGGYWQPLTGTLKDDESVLDCLYRELEEETGVREPVNLIKDVTTFDFVDKYNRRVLEFVYGVELTLDQKITLNPEEHSEYKWVLLDEALEVLKHDSNKNAIKILFKKLGESK